MGELETEIATLFERLQTRALRNQRSLEQEAVAAFEAVLAPAAEERTAEIARIIAETNAARSRMPRFLTDEEIAAAVREGRD